MSDALRWLTSGLGLGAVVLTAHPDDEAIGLGGHLPCIRRSMFLHVTDGAPRNSRDARTAGFTACEQYAKARRAELLSALALANIQPSQAIALGFFDQETSRRMVDLTRRLVEVFRQLQPEFVVTHPYEGGHPDHDATAFAARHACRLLDDGLVAPILVEMTSYHGADGSFRGGDFVPSAESPPETRLLTETQRVFKRRVFGCFRTQECTLSCFPIEVERFRIAPLYDFTQPPHAGKLWYERFDWGMTGPRWRELAADALAVLGIKVPACV